MRIVRNYQDFINEAKKANEEKEVELKVSNHGFTKMKNWFFKNTDLFKAHNNSQISPNSGVIHGDQTKKLSEAGMNVGFPFGYCYPVSQFVFYSLGGYSSDYNLKLIKGIKFEYKGVKGQTTHWFVQHKDNGTIIDLTDQQFDGVLDIMELYPDARNANLGFPYYTVDGKKVEFGHTVPCMQVLKLYDKYRDEVEKIPGLEKYWSAAKYATTRRKANESLDSFAYTAEEMMTIPANEQYCFTL
jgi:hypothetical protein